MPKDMSGEIVWYFNISIAFSALGKRNEWIALLEQLEEVAIIEIKEQIQKSIRSEKEKLIR
ncbi:hypothetical protein [Lactococcus petauri]|uniref:hypothetical protein n=1 Tax=Lactococcus petauri TaxID=1940789 RepID=UPI0031FEF18D